MAGVKNYAWEQRSSIHTPPDLQRLYVFKRSYEDCDGKNLKSILSGIIEDAEKTHEVTYKEELAGLFGKNQMEPVLDPLLVSIFGKKPIDKKAMLDYYEKDAEKNLPGLPFVDLCVLLGEIGRAKKFASRTHSEYDILQILNKSNNQIHTETLCQEGIRMWLEKAIHNRDAARLTSIIYRCCGCNDEHVLSPLAELWGEGYFWDTFCLANILIPKNTILPFLRNNIPRFLNSEESAAVAKLINNMTDIDNNKCYDLECMRFIDPISMYRILKIDTIRNEKRDPDELKKLVIRSDCSKAMRHVILACFITHGPLVANAMAAEAVAFVSENQLDFFPHAEKFLFETCIRMIGDVFYAVQHILGVDGPATMKFENEEALGIINILFAHWKKQNPDMWSSGGRFARSSSHKTCYDLLAHLMDLEKLVGRMMIVYNRLKLAINLCWLFTSEDFDVAQEISGTICQMAAGCGFQEKMQFIFANRFTHNLYDKPVEGSFSSSEQLSGEALISRFQQLGTNVQNVKVEESKDSITETPHGVIVEASASESVEVVKEAVAVESIRSPPITIQEQSTHVVSQEDVQALRCTTFQTDFQKDLNVDSDKMEVDSNAVDSFDSDKSDTKNVTLDSEYCDDGQASSPTANLPRLGPRQSFTNLEEFHQQVVNSIVESASTTSTTNALDGLLKTITPTQTIAANNDQASGDANTSIDNTSIKSNSSAPSADSSFHRPSATPSQTSFNTGGFDAVKNDDGFGNMQHSFPDGHGGFGQSSRGRGGGRNGYQGRRVNGRGNFGRGGGYGGTHGGDSRGTHSHSSHGGHH